MSNNSIKKRNVNKITHYQGVAFFLLHEILSCQREFFRL